ncbi:3-deoxy-D-manno-octulosonic acid kinase [Luteibacter aegosomatissinici]|uniref:3-deoxy-D-manno-octulosonic acid kinase n=1 Tax=Luteibacter aegosomatissinici TaxID=2911539 RepID=UPI001FFBEE47|nr:3-deoxy-D-manno-octulosonic acid kinase [Luteibacter aegosomatissinici]UPG93113.1 3-deoxy-D-manno-octulosonic acid kinase [Luteibacter aegosomatissinici]
MTDQRVTEAAGGTILFDAARTAQVDADWFSPDAWASRGALRAQPGGRGGVAIIDTPAGEAVLRHYRRGGMVAALLGDSYLFTGNARTRSSREFRMLAELARRGLPVPPPLAARHVRQGLGYRADLITLRIPDARTLAERVADGAFNEVLASRVGELVARFHREGAWHADLNAHNILVNGDGLYVIDFDRGRLRPPASGWRRSNLARLKRSLVKVGAREGGDMFDEVLWPALVQAYEKGFGA